MAQHDERTSRDRLQGRFADFRTQLADRVFVAAGWLAVAYVPVLAWRVHAVGWHAQLVVHAALVVLALVVPFVLLDRMSLAVKSAVLVGTLLALGVAGVFSMGMTGTGYWWCLQAAALAATLYSLRAGIALALGSAGLLAVAGAGFVFGGRTPPFDLNAHSADLSAWSAFLVVVLFASVAILFALRGYQSMVERLASEVEAQRSQLERLVGHDQLTGLPLNSLARDRLEAALQRARAGGDQVAVLFIDLDGFKSVNDSHGHPAGDHLLQQISARLRGVLRHEDSVARVGGDEFIVILNTASRASAALVAQKLIEQVNLPVEFHGATLAVGASVGIAMSPDHGDDAEVLRRRADKAMYEAKCARKNFYCFAEDDTGAGPSIDGGRGAG